MTTEAYTLWLRLYDARMADWKTNEEQLAKVAAIIEADREEAARAERARITDLIRNRINVVHDAIDICAKSEIRVPTIMFDAINELRLVLREIEKEPIT